MRNLRREIKHCLQERLLQYEFKSKGRYGDFVRTKDNILQKIGLGFSNGGRNVSVHIDIICLKINEILIKLGEYDLMKTYTGMIGMPSGYLMPGNFYNEWSFPKEDAPGMVDSTVDEMMTAIIQYGFPYLDELSDENFLLERLLSDPNGKRYICYKRDKVIPVLYHLRGEDEKALDYIKRAIQKEGEWPSKEEMEKLLSMGDIVIIGNQSVSMNDYLAFARNFKKFIEAGHYKRKALSY